MRDPAGLSECLLQLLAVWRIVPTRGQTSQHLWANDTGPVDKGEGSALLFSLGQYAALQAVQRQWAEGEAVVRFPRRCVRDHSQTRQGSRASMGAKPQCGIWEASTQLTVSHFSETPTRCDATLVSPLPKCCSHRWCCSGTGSSPSGGVCG